MDWGGGSIFHPRVHRRFDASKTKQHSPNMFEAQVAAPKQSFTSPVTAAGVILGLSLIGKDIIHALYMIDYYSPA